MISQTAEYALRAIAYLAGEEGAARTTAQISTATQVPGGYLAKVMQSLGRAKLVRSQRGLHGGFKLTKAPNQISVLDIINAVDSLRRIEQCPLGSNAHQNLCPLHHRLDSAVAMVEESFRDTTVAELLTVPSHETSTCRFPRAQVGGVSSMEGISEK